MNDADNELTQLSPTPLPPALRAPDSLPAPKSLWQTISVEIDNVDPQPVPPSRPAWRALAAVAAATLLAAGVIGATRLISRPGEVVQLGAPSQAQTPTKPASSSSSSTPRSKSTLPVRAEAPLPLADQDQTLSGEQTTTALHDCAQAATAQKIATTSEWTVLYAMGKKLNVSGWAGTSRVIVLSDGQKWVKCASDWNDQMEVTASAPQTDNLGIPQAPATWLAGRSADVLATGSGGRCVESEPTTVALMKGETAYRVNPQVNSLRARLVVNGTAQPWATTVPDRGLAFLVWGTDSQVKATDHTVVEIQALDSSGTPLLIQGELTGNPRLTKTLPPTTTMTATPTNPCNPG